MKKLNHKQPLHHKHLSISECYRPCRSSRHMRKSMYTHTHTQTKPNWFLPHCALFFWHCQSRNYKQKTTTNWGKKWVNIHFLRWRLSGLISLSGKFAYVSAYQMEDFNGRAEMNKHIAGSQPSIWQLWQATSNDPMKNTLSDSTHEPHLCPSFHASTWFIHILFTLD